MILASNSLSEIVLQFSNDYIQHYKDINGCLPLTDFDTQWLSPCENEKVENNNIFWQPTDFFSTKNTDDETKNRLLELSTFNNIESALNLTLHNDIKSYFTTIFSENLEAECDEGMLFLLFAWNAEDFARLQENIIGHLLMKQQLKQAETVFFAVTNEDDMIISIMNDTGEVWVERVGCKPHKKLSNSIAEFLIQLKPVVHKGE